jgi:DNA primase
MTDVQLIKDRVDIVQLIQEYVPLKKAGVNWKAPCPFHQEKSPSFMVNPEKQIWHCFGCNKGGDVFSFLEQIEGLEFTESLTLLARRAGVELTNNFSSKINQTERNRMQEINAKAAYFFHHFLLEIPASQIARDYLKRRNVQDQTLLDWQIGYIPDQWDLLTRYLLKKGYSTTDLVNAGLVIKREGADEKTGRGFYDRFRGRVMFPICDLHGAVVGFTGRVLVETEKSGGKYVNSPQTMIYDKSRLLYGLDKAKTAIKAKGIAIIVEGQMDVISCHQMGMKNVVAASGTALTPEQIKLLKRYCTTVAVAFDADGAGENADKRGIQVAIEQGLSVKVISIPSHIAKDADECINKDPKIWIKAVEDAMDSMEWYFKTVFEKYSIKNPKDKQTIATILLEQISHVPSAVEKDHWIKKLAENLRVEREVLLSELKLDKNKSRTNYRAATPDKKVVSKVSLTEKLSRIDVLSRAMWSLIIKFPKLYGLYHKDLKADYFKGSVLDSLYELCQTYYNNDELDVKSIQNGLLKPNSQNIFDILLLQSERDYFSLNSKEAEEEFKKLLSSIKLEWIKNRRKELESNIREAENKNDQPALNALLREIQEL